MTENDYVLTPATQIFYPYYSYNYSMPISANYNQRTLNNDSNKKNRNITNYNCNNFNQLFKKQITITWNLSAYVEEKKKESLLKRCCCLKKNATNKEKPLTNGNLVSIPIPNDNTTVKHILKNVCGIVKPGQLCAILGSSGAGKTTLLNAINFRNRGNVIIEGDVKINGEIVDWKRISSCSGYVQQEDVFLSSLTVKEHLTFSAIMKLGRNMSKAEKLARVNQVMLEMNLIHVKDTLIGEGDRLRGISGGEKRRLSFATELLANFQLLFCDEPTSGLDTFMAESVVESLKYLAFQGKTIISTIHQPSSQIFEKFDRICLLSEGRVAYMGSSKDSFKFFESIGYPCPSLYNPADHYVNVLAIVPNQREECLKKVDEICDKFQNSQYFKINEKSINLFNVKKKKEIKDTFQFGASFLTQIIWLLWRSNINSYRDPRTGKTMLITSIVVGILLGLIYLRLGNDQNSVQDKLGVIFFLIMHNSFGFMLPLVNTFPSELRVFYRETKNRVYSVVPYYLAKQIAELPKFVILPLVFSTIAYSMTNINSDGNVFIVVILIMLLASQCGVSFGLFVSIIAPSAETAASICGALVFYFAIIGGFFIDNNSVPVYFLWFKYISFFFYANEAINIKIWKDNTYIACTLPDVSPNSNCSNPLCFSNGAEVLEKYSIMPDHMDRDIGLLFVLLVVPRVLGLIFLKLKISKL